MFDLHYQIVDNTGKNAILQDTRMPSGQKFFEHQKLIALPTDLMMIKTHFFIITLIQYCSKECKSVFNN